MNKQYIVLILAISLIATGSIGGCGSTRYMTENPIDNKTLENIVFQLSMIELKIKLQLVLISGKLSLIEILVLFQTWQLGIF